MRVKMAAAVCGAMLLTAGATYAQTPAPPPQNNSDLSKVAADFSDFSNALALANSSQERLRADLGGLVQSMNGKITSEQSAAKTKDGVIAQLRRQEQQSQEALSALRAAEVRRETAAHAAASHAAMSAHPAASIPTPAHPGPMSRPVPAAKIQPRPRP